MIGFFQFILWRVLVVLENATTKITCILVLKKKNIRIISKAPSLEHRKPIFKNSTHQTEIYLHIFHFIKYYFNTLFSTNPISTTIHITLCKRLATRYFNRSSKTPNIPSGISLEYTQSLTTYSSKVQPNKCSKEVLLSFTQQFIFLNWSLLYQSINKSCIYASDNDVCSLFNRTIN